MKYIYSIFFSLLLLGQVFAQKKQTVKVYGISLDTIDKMVQKHPKYFDFLKNKSQMRDKKMSEDEWVMLYYGSVFQKDYNPKKEDKAVEQIANKLAEMDFNTAITEAEKLRKIYPVNARLYMLMGYAYKKIGKKQQSKWYYKRYGNIIRIPLYSGTGASFEQAFVVRIVSDEYLILNQKDLELSQQALRYHNKYPYDVLGVQKKSAGNQRLDKLSKQKLYFNIYLPFFVGQNKTFKKELESAKKKFKVKNDK